jgi:hypothetical protein
MEEQALSLLNVFDVVVDGRTRHVLCFLDPVLAGVRGIDPRWTIGDIAPGPDGQFDAARFTLNAAFTASVTRYMNDEASRAPELQAQAAERPSQRLHVLDSRYRGGADDAPASEVLGGFAVDDTGRIAPGSFQYNAQHVWFEPTYGVSGLLRDRRFYGWLHGEPR